MLTCIIAIPVTLFILTSWLDTFPYRVELSWWMHLLLLIIINAIAMLVIFGNRSTLQKPIP